MTHYVKLTVTKKRGGGQNIFKQKSKKADISNRILSQLKGDIILIVNGPKIKRG